MKFQLVILLYKWAAVGNSTRSLLAIYILLYVSQTTPWRSFFFSTAVLRLIIIQILRGVPENVLLLLYKRFSLKNYVHNKPALGVLTALIRRYIAFFFFLFRSTFIRDCPSLLYAQPLTNIIEEFCV